MFSGLLHPLSGDLRDRHPIARLRIYLRPYRRAMFIGFCCVVLRTTAAFAAPWILGYVVDDLRSGVHVATIRLSVAALLGLGTAGALLRFIMSRHIAGAARRFEHRLRTDYFAGLERFDAAYFDNQRTGDLTSRAINDMDAVREMASMGAMYAPGAVLLCIVGTGMMLSVDIALTLIVLSVLPVLLFAIWRVGTVLRHQFGLSQEQFSMIFNVLQETLSGVRVLRAYGREGFAAGQFVVASDGYVAQNRQLIALSSLFHAGVGLLLGTGGLVGLWLCSREVIRGRLSVGELVAFNGYFVLMSAPLLTLAALTSIIQRGMASWARIEAVLAAPRPMTRTPSRELAAPDIRGEVEFRHLAFAYGGRQVFQQVSARIQAGSTTAIVGATGSGKSTLLSVLARLRHGSSGSVLIDGVELEAYGTEALRRCIGLARQEEFIFGGTIGDNVAFGLSGAHEDDNPCASQNPPSRDDAVARAAFVACLDEDVAAFPQGYDTIVGERGVTLSGGQKQRIALARVLATDPPILLLDDALSAVDAYTEARILSRLRQIRAGRTTIIVSNRISAIRDADQIVVLDAGAVAEHGTHDELVAKNGPYATLYRNQLLRDELEAS